MASYGMNDVKNGMKILVNNQPAVIIDTEYVKPGKGQAFTRVKYRLIKDGRTQEVTMKSTDSLDAADVVDTDMNFMYSDGEYWHFMDPESFEQVQATKAGMGGAEKWLKGEESCVVTLWNGEPIFVQPPNFVELKITEPIRASVATPRAAAASRPPWNRCRGPRAAVREPGRSDPRRHPFGRILRTRQVIRRSRITVVPAAGRIRAIAFALALP